MKQEIAKCRRLSIVLAIVGAAVLAGMATPADAQGTPAQRESCEGDAFRFCSQNIPFVHAIENCLYRNMRNLTPACRVQMQGGTAKRRR